MELDISKGVLRRHKKHFCACFYSLPDDFQRSIWHTMTVGLLMNLSVTTDGKSHLF